MLEDALKLIDRIRALSEEDPTWELAFDLRMENYASTIQVHRKRQDVLALHRVAETASAELAAYRAKHTGLSFEANRRLAGLYHNVAAPLFFAGQYELAIPLFRASISLGMWEHFPYTWLAASLWATTQSRPEVLALLRQGADRAAGDYSGTWKELPEFQDVVNDPQFLAASSKLCAVELS